MKKLAEMDKLKPSKDSSNPNLRNILVISLGYSMVIGSFSSMAAIEQIILESVSKDDPNFHGNGYISLSIIYGVYSFSNFVAPSVIATIGARATMTVGTLIYATFIASFLYPSTWLLYALSALIGIGASWVWVSHGVFFTSCCNKENINKNMGIFWSILTSGPLVGNAFAFWRFQGLSHIDSGTRIFMTLSLTSISLVGTVILLFLKPPVSQTDPNKKKALEKRNVCSAFTRTFRLVGNKHMLLLIPTALYTGFEGALFASILPTAVGFTEGFGSDARKWVGIFGIVFGLGTVLGGLTFGVFGKYTVKSRRPLVVTIACVSHITAATLFFINVPNSSSLGPTNQVSLVNPPAIWIAILGAFVFGLGDGCLQPQTVASIGVIWPKDPSGALALFRFSQSATVAFCFFCGTMTGLYTHLGVMVSLAVVGTATFCLNEMLFSRKSKSQMEKPTGILEVTKMMPANSNGEA